VKYVKRNFLAGRRFRDRTHLNEELDRWDREGTNVRIHGTTIFYDPDHNDDEDRELFIAHFDQGRVLIISYTMRTDVIRIISARKATKSEEIGYAQGI